MSNADRAADVLIHYFALIARKSGVAWDSDNAAEIRSVVDQLMEAARDVAREEIGSHRENEPHPYADGSTS